MKAVILAGGGGSRLRPLTLGRSKAMVPILGRPLLGRTLELLCRHQVTQAALALHHLPGAVTDRLGELAPPGMELTAFSSDTDLGTAGAAALCRDFLGEEDFLVLRGDIVCDFDLTELLQFHRSHGGAATAALCRRHEAGAQEPVGLDRRGRVLGFPDRPAWEGELCAAGIWVLTAAALAAVPQDTRWDMDRDLLAGLIAQGRDVYGWEGRGCWRRVEDCRSYLSCCTDLLTERSGPELGEGYRSQPEAAPFRLIPPCWIGPRVSLAPGCVIGPCAVLEAGTTVATGAVVERSVLLGANVGEGAEVRGAILCPGASVHRSAMVGPGAVLGEGAVAEAESILAPGVKLWPGRRVLAGGRATSSLVSAAAPAPIRFGPGTTLSGTIGEELTPELLLALGALLGENGQVGLGWTGGEGAALLGRAASCGVVAAGGTALVSDAPCASAAAWLGRYSRLPAVLFLTQDGERARLRLTGPTGQPLDRQRLQGLEGALLRGEDSRVPGSRVGSTDRLTGVAQACALAAARGGRLTGLPQPALPLWVPQGSPEDDLLARALALQGCRVSRGEGRGLPILSARPGGLALRAWDEEGRALSPDRLLVLLARIHWEHSGDRVALPAWAPVAAEKLAARMGSALLRLGRDGLEAEQLWLEQPWAWDGIWAGCRLCARLALTGERLADLNDSLPPFATLRREVSLRSGRSSVLEAVLDTDPNAVVQDEGLRTRVGEGWVWLTPLSRRPALRLVAEAADMETAAELCDLYARKLRRLDEKTVEEGR